jgi:hypothetical protein
MDRIAQRLSRLRRHPYLSALYETIPYHTRQVIEGLLETGVTYPLMEKASECMDAEFQESAILQILANGDVLALDDVTAAALDELEYLLTTLDEENDE